jgi:uncharacterized coiled-coil protein SlyX
MASKILKGLTAAAGLGLVIGLGSGTRRAEENRMGKELPDDVPESGSLEARLDRIEARLGAMEARADGEEIETLHTLVSEHRRKVSAQLAVIEKRFDTLAREVPVVLESIVGPRVENLREHLRAEIQQSVTAALTKFERSMNNKVSERIGSVEKAVRDQLVTVSALSRRAVEADANVQRLVAAVERLYAGGTLNGPVLREPSFLDIPPNGQAKQSARRKSDVPAPPIEFQSGFQHQIIDEEEPEPPKRHRRPMARL